MDKAKVQICQTCGKVIEKAGKNARKYCSISCARLGQEKKRLENREDDPNWWGDNENCRKCIFSGINAHVVTCDYSIIKGRTRSIAEGIPADKCDLWKYYPRKQKSGQGLNLKKKQRAAQIADALMGKEEK